MTDETTPQDSAAMTPASAGSVDAPDRAIETQLREWAKQSGPQWYGVSIVRAAADEIARLRPTAAELEAVAIAAKVLVSEPSMNPAQRREWAETLHGFLDRVGFAR